MPLPLSGEARERATQTDVILNETHMLLHDPALELGIPKHDIAVLQQYFNSLYVPNIRNGELVTPKAYRDGTSLPFIAVRTGERFEADDTMKSLLYRQRHDINQFLEEIGSPLKPQLVNDLIDSWFNSASMPLTIDPNWYATTTRVSIPYRFTSTGPNAGPIRHVQARPNVVFNLSSPKVEPHVSGIVMLHELIHAGQILFSTVTEIVDTETEEAKRDLGESQAKLYGATAFKTLHANSKNPRYFNNESFRSAFERLS